MTGPFVPVRVTARMASGIAHATPWGIGLDGLLAAELWAAQKAARRGADRQVRALTVEDPPDLDLPLARCTPPGGPWHWAATCAHPDPAARLDVQWWSGRLDHRATEQVAVPLPRNLSARQGRYRNRRMPLIVTVTATLTWTAVGDPTRIHSLLCEVPAIGKKRSTGRGEVLAWTVEPLPGADLFEAGHLHPDGSLGRPVPTACHTRLLERHPDLVCGGYGRTGVRPPVMHPSRGHDLHLPASLDQP